MNHMSASNYEYNRKIPDYADVMTVEEYLENVKNGGFIDYDGYGYAVKGDKMSDKIKVWPSDETVPHGATHIAWFNR